MFEQLSNAGTIFSSPQAAVLLSTGLPTAAGAAMLNQVGGTGYRLAAVGGLLWQGTRLHSQRDYHFRNARLLFRPLHLSLGIAPYSKQQPLVLRCAIRHISWHAKYPRRTKYPVHLIYTQSRTQPLT